MSGNPQVSFLSYSKTKYQDNNANIIANKQNYSDVFFYSNIYTFKRNLN